MLYFGESTNVISSLSLTLLDLLCDDISIPLVTLLIHSLPLAPALLSAVVIAVACAAIPSTVFGEPSIRAAGLVLCAGS